MGVMGHDQLSEGVIDAEPISFSLPEGHSTHMLISQEVNIILCLFLFHFSVFFL